MSQYASPMSSRSAKSAESSPRSGAGGWSVMSPVMSPSPVQETQDVHLSPGFPGGSPVPMLPISPQSVSMRGSPRSSKKGSPRSSKKPSAMRKKRPMKAMRTTKPKEEDSYEPIGTPFRKKRYVKKGTQGPKAKAMKSKSPKAMKAAMKAMKAKSKTSKLKSLYGPEDDCAYSSELED